VAYDLSGLVGDIDREFFAGGGVSRVEDALSDGSLPEVSTDGLRLGAPIARPGKVVCIGLNYRDHAAETGQSIPERPIVFMKDPYTVVGAHDDVLIPRARRRRIGRSNSALSSVRKLAISRRPPTHWPRSPATR